jgi:hypothetical protein
VAPRQAGQWFGGSTFIFIALAASYLLPPLQFFSIIFERIVPALASNGWIENVLLE